MRDRLWLILLLACLIGIPTISWPSPAFHNNQRGSSCCAWQAECMYSCYLSRVCKRLLSSSRKPIDEYLQLFGTQCTKLPPPPAKSSQACSQLSQATPAETVDKSALTQAGLGSCQSSQVFGGTGAVYIAVFMLFKSLVTEQVPAKRSSHGIFKGGLACAAGPWNPPLPATAGWCAACPTASPGLAVSI